MRQHPGKIGRRVGDCEVVSGLGLRIVSMFLVSG